MQAGPSYRFSLSLAFFSDNSPKFTIATPYCEIQDFLVLLAAATPSWATKNNPEGLFLVLNQPRKRWAWERAERWKVLESTCNHSAGHSLEELWDWAPRGSQYCREVRIGPGSATHGYLTGPCDQISLACRPSFS